MTDDTATAKQTLRRRAVERILALDVGRRAAEDAALISRFPSLPGFETAGTVLLYARAFPEEIDTVPLLRLSLERGKRLVCPRADRKPKRLRLFEIQDPETDFEPGTLGIPEPSPGCPEVTPDEVDWVLVPGLAFDDRGYRVGRGAGHYDRLLPTLRPGVPCWALIYDEQWFEAVPVEPHDVPLDGVVSPSRVISRPSPRPSGDRSSL